MDLATDHDCVDLLFCGRVPIPPEPCRQLTLALERSARCHASLALSTATARARPLSLSLPFQFVGRRTAVR